MKAFLLKRLARSAIPMALALLPLTPARAMVLTNPSAPNYAGNNVTIGVTDVTTGNNVYGGYDSSNNYYTWGNSGFHSIDYRATNLSTNQVYETRVLEFGDHPEQLTAFPLPYDVFLAPGT